MEHSEIINEALQFTRKGFIGINCLQRWIKLFLFAIVPGILGFIISKILFQLILLPVLCNILINDSLGFTEGNISGLLDFCSLIIGILCVIFVPLIQGYAYRIFKTGNEMPSTENVFGLFFSGWRVNIVLFCYALPLIIISLLYLILLLHVFPGALTYKPVSGFIFTFEDLVSGAMLFIFIAVEFITFIFVSLFAIVALVHVARAGSLGEAIKFRKMAAIISRIGWYDYILSLVIMSILFLLISVVFVLIAQAITTFAGGVVLLLIYVFVMIPVITYFIKYMTEVYETAFLAEEEDDADFDDF
ncbi:MAG TPA: DUF4013 domain-containing protein [Methanocorpusculum sp.]|nr:DUF4013 domain-containing protein [Methanocorpusculum sp.]